MRRPLLRIRKLARWITWVPKLFKMWIQRRHWAQTDIKYNFNILFVTISHGYNIPKHFSLFQQISRKSDVWSLGCILYGLVFGFTPFQHLPSMWAKMAAITNPNHSISFERPSADKDKAEPIPSILVEVMRKCFQHEPKNRPTVDELLAVPYVSSNRAEVNDSGNSHIPPTTLRKIKSALTEDEWHQLREVSSWREFLCSTILMFLIFFRFWKKLDDLELIQRGHFIVLLNIMQWEIL